MKNALQSQLLKAGLVDSKKAKKINKQMAHAKRTGDPSTDEAKKAVALAKAKKLEKDQQLNRERQQALEQKTLKANIIQMIKQQQVTDTEGEIEYKFADNGKIKKIYLSQKFYEQVVAGHLLIARSDIRLEDSLDKDSLDKLDYQGSYALLPYPLAERINEKMAGFIVNVADKSATDKADDTTDEDDPYAEYVIPDDLMW